MPSAQQSLYAKKYVGIALTVAGIAAALVGLLGSVLAGPIGFVVLVGGIGFAALAKAQLVDTAGDEIARLAYQSGVHA